MATTRRSTRQQTALLTLLNELEGFQSAQDIHDLLRHGGERVGLSTVYRGLQGLAEAGEVDVLRTDSGEAVYRRCSTGHHHHLVCRVCGRTEEVESRQVEAWAADVGDRHGFADVSHYVEVFGTCAPCVAGGSEGDQG